MEQETYEVENRWRNKYMNLGRELGEIINSQQDRILSLSQENNKTLSLLMETQELSSNIEIDVCPEAKPN